jgi:glucosamine-6-phosphate deaminase
VRIHLENVGLIMLKAGQYHRITLEIVPDKQAVALHFARTMAEYVRKNNSLHQRTCFIMPVGPTGQYRLFAQICHKEKIDLSNLHIFNMDEYVGEDGANLPEDHPFSFARFLQENFYGVVDPVCNLRREQMHIPQAQNLSEYREALAAAGGIDVCFGGIGINGHLAFNEAPDHGQVISNEDFRNLPTRVVPVAITTKVVNAIFGTGGNIDAVPKLAVTVGMKEILASRKIHIYLDWPWQKQVLRHTLYGTVTPMFPASFLQEHPDTTITAAEYVAEEPSWTPE